MFVSKQELSMSSKTSASEPVTQKLQVGADGNWYNVVDVVTWWPLNSTRLHAKWVD